MSSHQLSSDELDLETSSLLSSIKTPPRSQPQPQPQPQSQSQSQPHPRSSPIHKQSTVIDITSRNAVRSPRLGTRASGEARAPSTLRMLQFMLCCFGVFIVCAALIYTIDFDIQQAQFATLHPRNWLPQSATQSLCAAVDPSATTSTSSSTDVDDDDDSDSTDKSVVPVSNDPFPFRFQRFDSGPHAHLYLTAWPNHGAGLGHQFGEWLNGPWLAMTHNLSYIHTPFLVHSSQWTDFLGFGAGEVGIDHLQTQYVTTDLAETDNANAVNQWLAQQIGLYDDLRASRLQAALKAEADTKKTDSVAQQTSAVQQQQHALARVLKIYRIHVATTGLHSPACDVRLNLILRQKYCAARVRDALAPLTALEDWYTADRAAGRFVVALHMRCGDSCYNPYRATNIQSVMNTVALLVRALTGKAKPVVEGQTAAPIDANSNATVSPTAYIDDPIVASEDLISLHLFSQSPHNNTATAHFSGLIDFIRSTTKAHVTSHFDSLASVSLHHMIQSDLLIGAQSSFSWIGAVLHHTVSMGPITPCQWNVPYNRDTGDFDFNELHTAIRESADHRNPQVFDSMDKCRQLKPIQHQIDIKRRG